MAESMGTNTVTHAEGRLVGIDIDHASRKVELPRLVLEAKG